MAVRLHEWQHLFGVAPAEEVDIVGFEGNTTASNHINAGIYVLNANALEVLKFGEHCYMPELFNRLQGGNECTIIYPMREPWFDVGRDNDLEQAQKSMPKK